ncbi:MAG: transglutaminase family protein [Maritimibacter sp.]|nr:transglutaminase family protein [Maritimibacter sp.]
MRHLFRYRYDAPVALGPYLLRLTPRGGQGMAHAIRVTPEPVFRRDEDDSHGNRVTRLGFAGATARLEIEARFELDSRSLRQAGAGAEAGTGAGAGGRLERYLQPGAADAGVAATAERLRALAERDPAGFAETLATSLHNTVDCDPADTAPLRSPGETLARGRGSLRDIAALYVDLTRRAGLPARFVTGYWAEGLHPAAARGGRSWAEVFLPEIGWTGYDPALGTPVGAGHVPVAAAPDLAGTLPIVGSTYGAAIRVSADFELNVMTRA